MDRGTKVLESYQADLKKSLLCGFESMEDVIKAKEYENTTRNVGLPVSTRAVGLSTVTVYNKVMATEANRQRLPNVTIFQIYRVVLAMVERKIFDNRIVARLDDRDVWYNPAPFEPFKNVITSLNICTQQIGALLRCISNFTYDDVHFVPLFPANQYDAQRNLIPVPEVVFLSNLRDVVTSLSNPNVQIGLRRHFMNKNPIPGARFDGALLTNGDQIMPANYNAEVLREDLYAVKNWIEAASELRGAPNKLFTQVQLTEQTHGNESMLVSSGSENLRIETNADGTNTVLGDITEFWFRSKMSDHMIFYGTYHMAGQNSSVARYLFPNYCIRSKNACGMSTKRSYRDVALAVES
jgi:hypothetical protein